MKGRKTMRLKKSLVCLSVMLVAAFGVTACGDSGFKFEDDVYTEDGAGDDDVTEIDEDTSWEDDTTEEFTEEETTEFIEEDIEEITEEDTSADIQTPEEDLDAGSDDVTINTDLTPEAETALNSLDTDYKKVKWGSIYSLPDNLSGIVISVTPCTLYGTNYGLVVAVTNVYESPVCFSGSATAKAADGSDLGDAYFYCTSLGSANTIIEVIDCGDTQPDGRLHWEGIEVAEAAGEYVPWEGDYSAKMSDGAIEVSYSMYAASGHEAACDIGSVYALILDEQGYVISATTDYGSSIGSGEKYDGSVIFTGNEDALRKTKDVAIFANPLAQ